MQGEDRKWEKNIKMKRGKMKKRTNEKAKPEGGKRERKGGNVT